MKEEQLYRVEFRVSVLASSPEQAISRGRERIAEEGECTAVFDENFDEV